MKADERKELDQNALAAGAATLVENVSTGKVLTPGMMKLIVLVAALALALGLWWYLAKESGKANSRQWAELVNPSPEELEAHAKNYKDAVSGRVARMEQARRLLGPQGIDAMVSTDRDLQRKGFDNIEKAREEFLKLAEELKSDKTLRADCLMQAAEAELALAGVPKDATGTTKRGDVNKAAEYYDSIAKIFGDKPAAEQYTKRADDLRKKAAEYEKIGRDLFDRANPVPTIDISPKFTPGGGVIAPGTIEPKKDLPQTPGVLPPTGPIQPPVQPPATTPTTGKK